MPKKKKKRKPRPAPSGPPKGLKEFAKHYACSHCRHSRVDFIVQGAGNRYGISIQHDEGCPVLGGILSDVPDAIRAAQAAGLGAMVVTDPFGGGTVE
ncbi:hypothetical protein GCM10010307_43490 [Streptomyces vastus]|uniref:Uncharacterized protein n=1 Tax=Streptomyces vastus TaxID=285451 RepID=A0ABP6DHZ2_9ACTN